MKHETKYTKTERNEMKRNEIYQNETKFYFVEVILEYNGIFNRSNFPVENTVIRKESYA